jgi:hypothetical protein
VLKLPEKATPVVVITHEVVEGPTQTIQSLPGLGKEASELARVSRNEGVKLRLYER